MVATRRSICEPTRRRWLMSSLVESVLPVDA
jgi:hypothetical protein